MPYDWQMAGDFKDAELEDMIDEAGEKIMEFTGFRHPVDLLMEGEKDPDAIRFAMAAHLSEMAVQNDCSIQIMNASLRRLEQALGR